MSLTVIPKDVNKPRRKKEACSTSYLHKICQLLFRALKSVKEECKAGDDNQIAPLRLLKTCLGLLK